MRHRVKGKKLGRDTEHRVALLANLAAELFDHKAINTTLVKAKYVRPFAEKLITKAREYSNTKDAIRRYNIVQELKKTLKQDAIVKTLVEQVAPKFQNRPGGYLRIIKTGERKGDVSPTARIELVEEGSKK